MNVERKPHRRDERSGAAGEFKEFKEFKEFEKFACGESIRFFRITNSQPIIKTRRSI
jgi:hypothetical protein